MQEEMICAGDIFAEVERAEVLDSDSIDNEIHTLSAGCGRVTLVCC